MFFPLSLQTILDEAKSVLETKLFEINQTPVTFWSIGVFLLVIFGFFVVSRLLTRGLLKRILLRFDIEKGIRYTMVRVSHYLIMLVGAVVAFQFVGVDLSGLAVIFGLLSVGIGFGLQNITSNFISGIILLFEQPIKVGDRITVADKEGHVAAIGMRATTIRSLQNISIIVPNSEFVSSSVINWSHGDPKTRLDVEVGVSYNSDLDTVLDALREVAEEHPSVLDDPAPLVLLTAFGDSSWNMQLRTWIPSPKRYYVIQSEMHCAIVRKFRERGVEIPFPQRDLHVRSPLPVPFEQSSGETSHG